VHKIKLEPNSPDEEKRKKKRRKIRGSGRKKEIRNDAGRGEKERRNGVGCGFSWVTLSGAMSHCLRHRQSSSTALSVIKFIKVNLLFLGFSFESKNEFLDIKNGF
jgi:hypothetical protein